MTYMTYPQNVIARAVELTKQNGGSTIGPKGDIPTEGFAFSPSKETEASVPIDQFNEDVLADYCVSRHDKLQEKRAHLGTWNYGDKTFMDVSEVVLDEHQAVSEAIKSSQIGIYDLKTGENKILSDYQQRADGSYLYKGKDTVTIPETSNRPTSEGWLSPSRIGRGIVDTCKATYRKVLKDARPSNWVRSRTGDTVTKLVGYAEPVLLLDN